MDSKNLTIKLCAPRGFCAGVERAIEIVILALKKYGAPVYVRHEIVHNKYVVDGLKERGAIFIEELNEIPLNHRDKPVIFSAHGIPKSVNIEADNMNLLYFDATCPLVSKVHKQAIRHHRLGRHVLLIGHAGHPEVIGTMGQLPVGAVTLITNVEDVDQFQPADPANLGFVTQTTLSIADTAELIDHLKAKFPLINEPVAESICYATTNRQKAVSEAATDVDLFLVVGAINSSNSRRLVEVAKLAGAKFTQLVADVSEIDFDNLPPLKTVGISAGASAPEILVQEVLDAFAARFNITVQLAQSAIETERFLVNTQLRDTEILEADMAFLHGQASKY